MFCMSCNVSQRRGTSVFKSKAKKQNSNVHFNLNSQWMCVCVCLCARMTPCQCLRCSICIFELNWNHWTTGKNWRHALHGNWREARKNQNFFPHFFPFFLKAGKKQNSPDQTPLLLASLLPCLSIDSLHSRRCAAHFHLLLLTAEEWKRRIFSLEWRERNLCTSITSRKVAPHFQCLDLTHTHTLRPHTFKLTLCRRSTYYARRNGPSSFPIPFLFPSLTLNCPQAISLLGAHHYSHQHSLAARALSLCLHTHTGHIIIRQTHCLGACIDGTLTLALTQWPHWHWLARELIWFNPICLCLCI